jgi:wyosine [tRNA(Phe)-imidazoG37] synthetase (radical SAM superfamily)
MILPSKPAFVFGPVISRRLGRSLGVDLVPFKTCSYDCIYCQLGRTTNLTTERRPYAAVDAVLAQVQERLAQGPPPDIITLAGSGEPTLHSGLGAVIRGIKRISNLPVAVLTNGSLLSRSEVREDLMAADLVAPDLDAGEAELFAQVCRPHPTLRFEEMLDGLAAFLESFPGRTLLEVFLVEGVNAHDEAVAQIAHVARRVGAREIQLNTLSRPAPWCPGSAVSRLRLAELARFFSPPAQIVGASPFREAEAAPADSGPEDVLAILACHPAPADEIVQGLSLDNDKVQEYLRSLLAAGKITTLVQDGKTYYLALHDAPARPDQE